jgi:hypothetical protein
MSIVVGVRVRPFNQREKQRESVCCIDMPGNNQTKIVDDTGKEKTFTFDHSFWSHDGFRTLENGYMEPEDDKYADQKIVFDTVGKQILDNAWQGYHCCLFAYGQTGAGKSYSMVGYGENKGIVPISCNEIFRRIGENKDPDKSFEVQVSMLEIYNEKVQDLLINPNKRPSSGLKIRESKVLGIFVDGLSKHPVTSYDEISNKMDDGYNNRTIGSTLMNATSSRAHTIVTIEFKQITMVAKKKSEKLSMINLVDLAGSERSGSTGATGDRLKEGCNINKSLLILGNVINCLADKAIGKNKNMLPPYRDSALTRILQNALGGNSKTVMICALSPASINYEETLSTLRYADRAKKIQNKAVINESEHDKMVRMLKEENVSLKKMIEDLQKKIGGGGGGSISAEDQQAFLELKEQYEANQKVMGDMQKTFEERLEEAKKHEGENIGQKVDIKLPHLVVLNEDPQLSYKLRYPLNELPVYVGRKHGNPEPQIKLSGIGIKQNHAVFVKQGDEILLKPQDKEAQKYIYINGKKIGIDGQIIKTKDRIVFGNNTIFVYMKKSTGDDIYSIDWESAQMELQKEIELENKRQIEENEKKKQEEINLLKKDYEEEYSKRKKEIEETLRKQVEEYELKLKEINQNVEKQRIEQERLNQERKLKERIEQLEEEKVRKKREIEIKEKEEMLRREQLKKEQENIHNSEKLENNLTNILKKIQKMKIIITELKRNINLDAILQKNLVEEIDEIQNGANIAIRVENYEEGTVYYWTPDIFHNRYDLMKELFNKFNDEELDLENLKNEDDPLWDEAKPVLIGYSFYKLEPLSYLIGNQSEIAIISPNGNMIGKLEVDVAPHDEDGNEFDEVPETPSELIGQCLQYKVCIYEVKNIPKNFSSNLKVEYQCFTDHTNLSTKIYNKLGNNDENNKDKNVIEIDEESVSIQINEEFEHKIDYLTKEDIEYIEKEKLCFKIYAVETVEKKGKTPININEEIDNQKEEEEEQKKEEVKNDIKENETDDGFVNIEKINKNEEIKKPEEIVEPPNKKKKGKNKEDCLIY